MHFVLIGQRIVNLAAITYIEVGQDMIRVHFTDSEFQDFCGTEAEALGTAILAVQHGAKQ